MKVIIVILHYLGTEQTEECLTSVGKLNHQGFILETIVVNNNPKEDLKDLEKKFTNFDFVETGKNLGFAGGNNLGIKKALKNNADFVMLLNNDTLIDQSALVQLIKQATSINQSGVLGPKIYFASGYEFHKGRYKPADQGKVIWFAGGVIDWKNVLLSHRGVDEVDKGQYGRVQETDFVTGCCMLIKKEVFEKIGLLNEKYFLYLEDADFCQRAKKTGFNILYVPEAKVWHFNAGSSEVGGSLHDYYFARNRMLFGMKYAPIRSKIALFKESLGLLKKGREWQKRGIRDFYFAVAGKATRNKLAYLKKFGKGSWR